MINKKKIKFGSRRDGYEFVKEAQGGIVKNIHIRKSGRFKLK